MSVYKYKTFEQAEKDLWNFKPDQEYYQTINELFELLGKLQKTKCERGIHKFYSLADANAHRYGK